MQIRLVRYCISKSSVWTTLQGVIVATIEAETMSNKC